MKIVVVGVGALGSHVVQTLRNIGELAVVDFDRIERKNVLAQFHARNNVGRNKAEAIGQSMAFLFGVRVTSIPHKLEASNAEAILGRANLVIDCLDNGAGRRVIQDFVRVVGIPCLHGALAADGAFGRVVWDEQYVIETDAAGGATCEDGEHLPFIATVSSLVALTAQAFLRDGKRMGFQVHPGGVVRI